MPRRKDHTRPHRRGGDLSTAGLYARLAAEWRERLRTSTSTKAKAKAKP